MKTIFSIIMPTKDRGNLIEESIISVIDQTINDWELIIVDDNSDTNDQTAQIVSKFRDPRIKYFKLPAGNGTGIAAARNFGNAMAQGKYIVAADSDDINYPERLALTLEAFEKGADVVYGHYDVWDPKENKIEPKSGQYEPREFNPVDYKKCNFIPHPASSYLRQISLDFPYNSFFRRSSDYDFFSRLQKYSCKFSFVDKPLVKYRIHDGSITFTQDGLHYSEIVRKNRGWIK